MSFGLLVIAINIGYLIFSIIAGIALAKLLKKGAWFQQRSTALLAIVIFLLILFAPFYDLLIQKGIKTYYEVFDKTYATIYAYPEKDSEGRVESFGMDKEFGHSLAAYLVTKKNRITFRKSHTWIKYFSEKYFNGNIDENKTNDLGYVRVHLNKNPITYKSIEAIKDFKARYQVLTKINQHWFYKEIKTSFWDKKENRLLAQTLEVIFPIRNKKK